MPRSDAQKMEKQKSEQLFFERYGFLFGEKIISRGAFYPLHWHDYFECEILLQGSAEHQRNGIRTQIHTGDAYILSYEDTHSVRAEEDLHIFAVRFREDLLAPEVIRLLSEKNVCCRFSESEIEYIRTRVARIRDQNTESALYKHILSALLSELILMILERSTAAQDTPLPSLVRNTAAYIRQHYLEPLSLASVSRILSVTPKYLGALFKKHMHISFHEFLNNTRLRHACHLLSSTDDSVKEIAFSSGYSSVEYFLDVFKSRMGRTPTAYRAEFRPDPIQNSFRPSVDESIM